MNLEEFRKILNTIPDIYNNVQITFICERKIYTLKDEDNIEWYPDEETGHEIIDITISKP